MIADWLLIVTAFAVLWVMWKMFNLVGDLIEYAARRGEDAKATKGKGSFS